MLRRVEKQGFHVDEQDAVVRIADASFPVPFKHRLEFNAPVHGPWNIVHVGMQVPECHQIYVCADNCMRGVVLTAAEMDARDRFSCVLIEENDLYDDNLETITIEGVTDAINRLPYRPRAVAVFLVCLHHFVGTDVGHVYRKLEERFPDIDFMRCWMDPVMMKTGLAPEQKLKEAIFKPVRPLPVDPGLVCVLGDNQALDPDSDLARAVREAGGRILQLQDWRKQQALNGIPSEAAEEENDPGNSCDNRGIYSCETYEDYLRIGSAALFITRSPAGVHGITQLARRLGRPFLYLPPAAGAQEIGEELEKLRKALRESLRPQGEGEQLEVPDAVTKMDSVKAEAAKADAEKVDDGIDDASKVATEIADAVKVDAAKVDAAMAFEASEALEHARELISSTEITIDHIVNTRTLSLARLLLEHGFHVTRIYLDAVLPIEKEDFIWLQKNHPDLLLSATIHPKMRVLHAQENTGEMLALGPKAAWFGGTAHFVNLVEFGGMWGYTGIKKLAVLMEEAFLEEKDTRSIVPRKGQGCACVL